MADFMEFGELMCRDALDREESCGGHFREEHQTPDGEAKRDDEHFCHVAAWEYAGADEAHSQRRAADLRERQARRAELQVKITLKVWRQKDAKSEGRFVTYEAPDVNPETCRSSRCSTS